MQRFTCAGYRYDLRVICQLAGIRPAPVNIMLNRSYKPRIARCFWVNCQPTLCLATLSSNSWHGGICGSPMDMSSSDKVGCGGIGLRIARNCTNILPSKIACAGLSFISYLLLQKVGAGKPHSTCKKMTLGDVVSLVAHDNSRGNVNSLVKAADLRKLSAPTLLPARLGKRPFSYDAVTCHFS